MEEKRILDSIDTIGAQHLAEFFNQIWTTIRESLFEYVLLPAMKDLPVKLKASPIPKLPKMGFRKFMMRTPRSSIVSTSFRVEGDMEPTTIIEGNEDVKGLKKDLQDYAPSAEIGYLRLKEDQIFGRIKFTIPMAAPYGNAIFRLFNGKEETVAILKDRFIALRAVVGNFVPRLTNLFIESFPPDPVTTDIKLSLGDPSDPEHYEVDELPGYINIIYPIEFIDENAVRPGGKEEQKAIGRLKSRSSAQKKKY